MAIVLEFKGLFEFRGLGFRLGTLQGFGFRA